MVVGHAAGGPGTRLFGRRAAAARYALKQEEAGVASTVGESVRAQPVVKVFGLAGLARRPLRPAARRARRRFVRAEFLAELVGSARRASGSWSSRWSCSASAPAWRTPGTLTTGSLVAFLSLHAVVSKDAYDLTKKVIPAPDRLLGRPAAHRGAARRSRSTWPTRRTPVRCPASTGPLALEGVTLRLRRGAPRARARQPRGGAGPARRPGRAQRLRARAPCCSSCCASTTPSEGRVTADGRRPPLGHAGVAARPDGRRVPGELPVRRHDAREHRPRQARRHRRGDRAPPPRPPRSTTSSRRCPKATTRRSASWAAGCRAASASASPSPAPCCATPRCCCSTRPPRRSTRPPRRRSTPPSSGSRPGAWWSSSPTAWPRPAPPTASSCSTGGRVVESGTHDELLARGGLYRCLWDKQSGIEVSADGQEAASTRTAWRRSRCWPRSTQRSAPRWPAAMTVVQRRRGRASSSARASAATASTSSPAARSRSTVGGDAEAAWRCSPTATSSARWRCSPTRRGRRRCARLQPCTFLTLDAAQFQSILASNPGIRAAVERTRAARTTQVLS